MSRRKDPLIEFRDYYNSLSPDAQDVARRLLFGEAKQRPKSSSSAASAGNRSSRKPKVVPPAASTETDGADALSAAKASAGGGE